MSDQSISKMLSAAKGLATNNRFTVQITKPGLGQAVMFNCYKANIPSRTLNTTDSRHYGAARKVAVAGNYGPVSLGFYLSVDHAEHDFFTKWHEEIVPITKESGVNFNPAYYDDYVAKIIVTQVTNSGKLGQKYTIEEAYPLTVGSIEYEFTTKDIQKLEVQFAYYRVI